MLEALRNLSPQTRARLSWALAPVLAGLAVLLQYIIDVPKARMIGRDDTSPAKHDDSQADGDPTPDKPKPRPRKRKSKSKSKSQKPKPRSLEQVQQLRETWSSRPLEEEPTDPSFRRSHETLLRGVATRARSQALAKRNPIPLQIRPTCRTLRCALELCGDRALVDDVAELLPRANVAGASLWHELREVDPTRRPAKHEPTDAYRCRRWIVDFALDGVDASNVSLDEPKR